MRLTLILSFAVAFCHLSLVYGQVENSGTLEEQLLEEFNAYRRADVPIRTAKIYQDGANHRADVVSSDSYINVNQQGINHEAEVLQQGANGQIILQQIGTGHRYSGRIDSDGHYLNITQRGQNHNVVQDLVGDNLNYRIVQEGQGHQFIQTEHDPLAPAYEVRQEGTGMSIIIEQGFVGLPPK